MVGCAIFQRIGIVKDRNGVLDYDGDVRVNESPKNGRKPSIFAFSDRNSLISALRQAIDRNEIEVLFQPQIQTKSGRFASAEALARWNHPKFGELGASELFALAREASLTAPLSRMVAGKALKQACNFPTDLRLSINVTPSELNDTQFEAHFGKMLNESRFPTDRLILEITEDEPLENLPAIAQILSRLKSSGIRIALDDFGSGYCSFAYLKQLPLDSIKLDRSIITGIERNGRDLAIFRNIMNLAQELDLEVVAEGIENDEQRQIAVKFGCAYLQGFLIAEPQSLDALMNLTEV